MCEIKTNIMYNINSKINEEHDKILLKEVINVCGTYDLLEYEVDVNILKEALDLYFYCKSIEKSLISKVKEIHLIF